MDRIPSERALGAARELERQGWSFFGIARALDDHASQGLSSIAEAIRAWWGDSDLKDKIADRVLQLEGYHVVAEEYRRAAMRASRSMFERVQRHEADEWLLHDET